MWAVEAHRLHTRPGGICSSGVPTLLFGRCAVVQGTVACARQTNGALSAAGPGQSRPMGGRKIQSLWGSATNFALAGTLFGASISLLTLFCYCCRKTQRESLNSCRALFGGSIILLFLFCYCCQRKGKKPATTAANPTTTTTITTTTNNNNPSNHEEQRYIFLHPNHATHAPLSTSSSGSSGPLFSTIDAPTFHHDNSILEISHWFPEAPTPPPPYELVSSKKFYDSPPPYEEAIANVQCHGYVWLCQLFFRPAWDNKSGKWKIVRHRQRSSYIRKSCVRVYIFETPLFLHDFVHSRYVSIVCI